MVHCINKEEQRTALARSTQKGKIHSQTQAHNQKQAFYVGDISLFMTNTSLMRTMPPVSATYTM